ncbi:hypothetical protein CWE12_01890 [Aliidiomarina sedimenti]|uniref:DUF3859 domain-containing protein n=1 Tax=Aliidiomarina sedimenti TaxID=1933879 RepID=A0ABY0C1U9_9GAMM|nr:hypothetical protein [Aliidiomarina sedimenti]RUO31777.1 hypothetical protein CWE12_01890 [Aliidiomarina sedimenti]
MLPISLIKSLLLLMLGGAALVACTPQEQTDVSKNPFCAQPSELDNHCLFEPGQGIALWLVSSDVDMPIERGIKISLVSNDPVEILHSEIRGLSMYMGRLPVSWEQAENGLWYADILLGACTDPKMVWELRLEVAHAGQSYSLRVPFTSYIP